MGKFFYIFEKYDDYYSLWVIDKYPDDFEEKILEEFRLEHETEGDSTSGSYQEVMNDLIVLEHGSTDNENPVCENEGKVEKKRA